MRTMRTLAATGPSANASRPSTSVIARLETAPVASSTETTAPATVKPLALSRLTSWAGVSGFYIPFTGEVTFNADVPAFDLPMVIAHHKAMPTERIVRRL